MPVDMGRLIADLAAETRSLTTAIGDGGPDVWSRPTPAAGWVVRDQITHLAFFDEAAVMAATDPAAFAAHREEAGRDVDSFTTAIARRHEGLTGPEVLEWFATARARLAEVFTALDPATRIPWYGPEMSPASAVTARVMETWAHGQDVYDALGVAHPTGPALRQVAHIGVRTFAFSFTVRGRPVPGGRPALVLAGPGGERWEWAAEEGGEGTVEGHAVEFCLVVTQRRHVDDTSLRTRGPVAEEWMRVAQAFAGPPGPGRPPGRGAATGEGAGGA